MKLTLAIVIGCALALAVIAQSARDNARIERRRDAMVPVVVTNKLTKYEWQRVTNYNKTVRTPRERAMNATVVSNLVAITPMGRTNRQFIIQSKAVP